MRRTEEIGVSVQEQMVRAVHDALAMIAAGRDLHEILDGLVRQIERQSDGMLGSVLIINEIRTYRDLVDAVLVSLDGRQRDELRRSDPLPVRSRLVPAGARPSGSLERTDALTPYALEIIGEDAVRAGRGAYLELTVSTSVDDADLAAIRDDLAWLECRGVGVTIRRDAGVAGGMLAQEE